MGYSHVQRGKLHYVLYASGAMTFGIAWLIHGDPGAPWAVWLVAGVGLLCLLLSACFMTLTVEDGGDRLAIRYGPVSLFAKSFPYDKIESAEPDRSSWIDGWGIHYVPGRGWTYNLWGFDCVRLTVDGRTVRIGTDDPEGLTQFLNDEKGVRTVFP